MNVKEIKKICPDIIHLPSDYETYSLFSKRMFSIVRRYTEVVEEYSIDECFAEITGLRRPLKMNYQDIAAAIKKDLDNELGMTFSIGLGPTKVIAKIASKWKKPSGLTAIPGKRLPEFLRKLPIADVWGIGDQTAAYMRNFGIKTALDFTLKEPEWVKERFTKPHQEIWYELRGTSVLALDTSEKRDYKTISKTKTFTPAVSDRDFVFSQLSKNIENACIKARRHGLVSSRIFFLLRTQDYRHYGYEVKMAFPTAVPTEIIRVVGQYFHLVFNPRERYRLTGIVLADLRSGATSQLDLFGSVAKIEKVARVFDAIDLIDKKFGKHTVFTGASMAAIKGRKFAGERAAQADRKGNLFKGETARKRLGIPMLGIVN